MYDGTWKIFFRSFASDEIHTGVIIAPGIRATPAKHKGSSRFNSITNINIDEYPVMVDRADPRRFVILWNEVTPYRIRQPLEALDRAQAEADRLNAPQDRQPSDWPGAK
jgi:hypothetical protein